MENRAPSRWAWLWFTLLRVGLFAVLLAVFAFVLPVEPWVSAILAAVIALCVSYIFLSRPRAAVSQQIADTRAGKNRSARDADDEAEDAAVEEPGARA